jgi:transcription antitermination factor NusG
MFDSLLDEARTTCLVDARGLGLPLARGPPVWPVSCVSYAENHEITIKAGRGGFRVNATGGLRSPPGGRPRALPEPPPNPFEGFRWYVVRTVHGQTDLADQEIREAGFEVVTARICRPATPARRSASGSLIRAREERYDPLFVRYIIVSLDLADPAWHSIPAMDSVERIISGGYLANNGVGIPIAVPDSAIERLREKVLTPSWCSTPTGIVYPPGYRPPTDDGDLIEPGTALRLSEGVLADQAAICEMSDGQRIMMLMNWFNRDNVRVSTSQSRVEVVLPADAEAT